MVKELLILARTSKYKEGRKYFNKCEENLNNNSPINFKDLKVIFTLLENWNYELLFITYLLV